MVDSVYRFNGSNNDPVTAGNSGYSAATFNGGSVILSTAAADEGTTGIQFTSAAGLVCVADWAFDSPSLVGADGVGEWSTVDVAFWTPTVTPNVDSSVVVLRNATGNIFRLLYTPTGTLYYLGGAGTAATTLATSVALNTKFYLNGYLKVDTATTGKVSMRILNSSRTLVGSVGTQNAYNLGTTPFSGFRLGVATALTASVTHKYDTMRITSNITGASAPAFPGAYTPPTATAPSVVAPASQMLQQGASFTFTATASDPSGTIASYDWERVSGTGPVPAVTGATFTGTVPSTAGDTVYRVRSVSSTGLTSGWATFQLWTYATPGTAQNVDGLVSNTGGWGFGGTATDLIDGTSDTGEWVITAAGPNAAKVRFSLPPLAPTDTVIDFYVDLRNAAGTAAADVGQTGSLQAQLFSGSTAISPLVDTLVTATEAHVTITLTGAQNAAFTAAGRQYGEIEFTATAN